MSSIIGLVSAVLAALAFGVLSGYAVCAAFFHLIGHRRTPSVDAVLSPERAVTLRG